jgi:hypothetical protein
MLKTYFEILLYKNMIWFFFVLERCPDPGRGVNYSPPIFLHAKWTLHASKTENEENEREERENGMGGADSLDGGAQCS